MLGNCVVRKGEIAHQAHPISNPRKRSAMHGGGMKRNFNFGSANQVLCPIRACWTQATWLPAVAVQTHSSASIIIKSNGEEEKTIYCQLGKRDTPTESEATEFA
jgi:hypothetical protein